MRFGVLYNSNVLRLFVEVIIIRVFKDVVNNINYVFTMLAVMMTILANQLTALTTVTSYDGLNTKWNFPIK